MASDPLIGHSLGVYQVLERIGHGGMGLVYKGYDQALNRYVAIKLLPQALETDPTLTQRFQREAKAAAGLDHPNIVGVYYFGHQGDVHYLVMKYIEGTDLRAEIDRRRRTGPPFTSEEILNILGQVAAGLDYAHERGVIHRDVKPGNVLLASNGQAVLGDFGLAMLRDRASQITLGHSFGTPEYIAPEQAIDSRGAVPQSDIYSLGGILYEMVTDHLPFEAESSISLALKHISEDPTPPRRYVPDLPTAVEAAILRALAKEPGERFATARAMIEALRQAWHETPSAGVLAVPATP
ncbi:MAG: serine/threonine protein kinase, partial [Thermoflexales bacterium]|nr:serine/threonine protein kinase [Thermoflexales bacterium]